ncbi:hypothetical protein OAD66_06280 [Bacteroidia bacterium]|nr:hypothetical protein [Bacteroidia bacterium]MDB9882726.1 hypothetical protein [Bacteroidia bacterium]
MKQISKLILIIALFTAGCKSVTKSSGEKVNLFKGTIVYDVEVVQIVDSLYEKNKKALFGDEMYLTIFRNGDIQRKYNGASSKGYDLHYIDLEQNTVMEKYNNSDSLHTHSASAQNMVKLNSLRDDKQSLQVLDYDLQEVAIGAEAIDAKDNSRKYLTVKYWYADGLKIDETNYSNVNDDLWNYFINKSDGSLYLKYEIDYFTYKVIYTAKEILPNKFEKSKDKIGSDVPRIEN